MNGQHDGPPPGHEIQVEQKRVPMVNNVFIQNVSQAGEHFTVLIIGDSTQCLGLPMKAQEARKLAESIVLHAEALEREHPRILIPGGILSPPTNGGLLHA